MAKRSAKSLQNKSQKRFPSIDILRGIGVLLMVITHVNGYFYRGSGDWMDYFTWLGATVCFSIFLFTFAVGYGIKLTGGKISVERQKKRVLKIMGGYYFAAIAVRLFSQSGLAGLVGVFKILVFADVPDLTEFILAFVLFDILVLVFQSQLKSMLKKPWLLAIIAVLVYFVSRILYDLDLGYDMLNVAKSFWAGHDGMRMFGVFTYFPVFAAGLYWGQLLIKDKIKGVEVQIVLAVTLFIFIQVLKLTGISDWSRWPTSIVFLLYGFFYTYLFLAVVPLIERFELFSNTFKHMSRFTFEYYQLHVAVVVIIAWLLNYSQVGRCATIALLLGVFAYIRFVVLLKQLASRN